MTTKKTLVDWLDDLCIRFIVNIPHEELQLVERICFQIEEAQWFYEDFIRPLDPHGLPSMHLRRFSQLMFQHCPLFSAYPEDLHQQAYEQFLAYKTRVPVRGAIMLNQDMTHAVLVKGWKKQAKWSFPRGKINKQEDDLDCAVREVWEETGYALRDAGLVLPDDDMKKITVTMREQSMTLYVFRGVPFDTHFEPRTRKEISKIDWYKLTDLPTLRRKNQAVPQGAGQDLIKENNFYMVAPFLGPLKGWIKQQHKLDKQHARGSAHVEPPPVLATDDEDARPDPYDALREHAPDAQSDDNFADLVARLNQGHRPSDTLPEVSVQPPAAPSDPAAELKRLLSVGMGVQSPLIQTPSQQSQANPLLALFQQGSGRPRSAQVLPPRTPFDQIMSPPIQPQSPHGQHHPRPPQMANMGPPPPFAFPPHQGLPFQPPFNNGMHAHNPSHIMPHPQQQGNAMFHSPVSFQQLAGQQPPRPFQQENSASVHRHQPSEEGRSGSLDSHGAGPPASKLPMPKMSAHAMGLLNSFKSNVQKAAPSPTLSQTTFQAQSSQTTPRMQQHPAPRHQPNEPATPHFQSPPINILPAQPQPRSAHHDSLLTLFRGTPPIPSPEPAELSALPHTPAYASAQPAPQASRGPNAALLDEYGARPKGMTSATVRGPVNAPDFDTMRRSTQHPTSGSARGPSPATLGPQQSAHAKGLLDMFKSPSPHPPPAQHTVPPTQSPVVTGAPVAPSAHTRGLLNMFKSPSPRPPSVQQAPPPVPNPAFPLPPANKQKDSLLALFSQPSPKPQSPQIPPALRQSHGPIPASRSPLPPTPKTTISGLISPVSPLPEKTSHAVSPADPVSRSRISSIGDAGAPSIVIPPTSYPASIRQESENAPGFANGGGLGLGAHSKSRLDGGKSPVDKTFLLGLLEDVARRGR
jgi:mRNA-decapping enzyme subunit 2